MAKKLFLLLAVLFFSFSLFALRTYETTAHEYDSASRIAQFYNETELSSNLADYWNSVQVGLVTISKGPEFYSWFGHTGLIIGFPDGTEYLFDYGRFSFASVPLKDFALGNLWYWCGASSSVYQIQKSNDLGRTMSRVNLNLTAEQKRALVYFLDENCREENCVYLYRPLIDNCSTRIRDVLNRITDGDFETWAKQQPGIPFRDNLSRVFSSNVFYQWVLDAIQGRDVDKEITLWDEMFLPEDLEKAVLAYGKLGTEKVLLVDNTLNKKTLYSEKPDYNYWYSGLVAIVLSVLSCLFFRNRKLWTAFTTVVNTFIFLLGCFIFFVMFFTIHDLMWNNENLLFINPLIIAAIVLGFKRDKHIKALELIYFAYTEVILLLIICKIIFPAFFIQNNRIQIISLLPYYLVNWYLLKKAGLNGVKSSSAEEGNPLK